MIAVDTSAIVAILRVEPDEMRLRRRLETAGCAVMSVASLLELQLVLAGKALASAWEQVEVVLNGYAIESCGRSMSGSW